jgi:hypothetical protein
LQYFKVDAGKILWVVYCLNFKSKLYSKSLPQNGRLFF